jgi:uncharacterized membrane protein
MGGAQVKRVLLAYATTALAFCALDFAWLGLVAPRFYAAQIGTLLLAEPNLTPALIFYLLYVVGLVVFCVLPGIAKSDWRQAAIPGALLGLVAYGTYDLSNLATLQHWTTPLTIVDMAWGTAASAIASTCGWFFTLALTRRRT